MSTLVRLSFSMETSLVDQLEQLVKTYHYANRSEFIRDLIRSKLVDQEWENNHGETLGTITLIYDHHELDDKLVELQHDYHHLVLTTTHVHLDSDLCAEMIMVKGDSYQIRELASLLQQHKGVLHAALSMSSIGKQFK